MILLVSVILLTGEGVCLSACWDTNTPREQTPPRQTPPPPQSRTPQKQTSLGRQTPPKADTPPPEQTPPQEQTPQSRHHPEADTPLEQTPPPGSRLRDTVNERPVRILLECILVTSVSEEFMVVF